MSEKLSIQLPVEIPHTKCEKCGHKYSVIAPLGEGQATINSFDYCPYCGENL